LAPLACCVASARPASPKPVAGGWSGAVVPGLVAGVGVAGAGAAERGAACPAAGAWGGACARAGASPSSKPAPARQAQVRDLIGFAKLLCTDCRRFALRVGANDPARKHVQAAMQEYSTEFRQITPFSRSFLMSPAP
jgi:hypothetical protein